MSGESGMNARGAILAAVRAARPAAVAAPAARLARGEPFVDPATLAATFIAAATAAGAVVHSGARSEITQLAAAGVAAGSARQVHSLVPEHPSTMRMAADPHDFAALDLFVCEAPLAVAENGAVWFATSDAGERAALFLAQRVIIVVAERAIVATLHDAYATIDVSAHSFGAFIAGPSKTADIEQALVIGAHGPKELTVLLVNAGESATAASPTTPVA